MRKIRKFSFKRMMALALCLVMTVALCGCSLLDYKKGVMLYQAGAYQQAKELFDALGEHKDSAEYAGKVAEEFTDEEINSIYPIELIRAYKIEPTA